MLILWSIDAEAAIDSSDPTSLEWTWAQATVVGKHPVSKVCKGVLLLFRRQPPLQCSLELWRDLRDVMPSWTDAIGNSGGRFCDVHTKATPLSPSTAIDLLRCLFTF